MIPQELEAPWTPFGYRLGSAIPELGEMPLLDELVTKHKGSQPFKGVTALLIQHQLGNQGPLVQALIDLGLEPGKIFWLDIPYTSSELFRRTIQKRHRIPRRNFWINHCRVLEPYAEYQFRRTQDVLLRFLRKPPDKLLVLDDGAYFLDAAMSFGVKKQLPHIAIVEQTTRGITKIKENAALARYARKYPVLNVARSDPKLGLESPWIGRAILLSLTRHLHNLERRSPQFAVRHDSPCLVLGYGAVGRQVAAHLQSVAKVYVADTDSSQLALAERDGFPRWDRLGQIGELDPIEFKLVVGCTGRASFLVGDHGFLDRHAILVSASSGAVELSRSDFIDLALASPRDDLRIKTGRLLPNRLHQNVRMQLADRHVVFLNAGFPINFDGRLNCIPSRYMQPTAMLMVYGAIQARTTSARGLVEVDFEFAKALTHDFIFSLNQAERRALALGSSVPTLPPRIGAVYQASQPTPASSTPSSANDIRYPGD